MSTLDGGDDSDGIVIGHRARPDHRQVGLATVERLDLAFLVSRQHDGVRRRINGPTISRTLAANSGSMGSLNCRQARGAPYALHGGDADPGDLGHSCWRSSASSRPAERPESARLRARRFPVPAAGCVASGVWHTLDLRADGSHFTVFFLTARKCSLLTTPRSPMGER